MADFYPYLVASLPTLHFAIKPPFPTEKLLEKCQELIPEKDFVLLLELPDTNNAITEETNQPTIKNWLSFDSALRNELVKIRASRLHTDAQRYLRADGYVNPNITHIALTAYLNPSILEAERFLDHERWKALDELSIGHYFDLDFLIVYAYKLRILERWEKIAIADKQTLLEEAISYN